MHTLLGSLILLFVGMILIVGLVLGLAALTPKRERAIQTGKTRTMPPIHDGDMLQEIKRRELVAHLEKARLYEADRQVNVTRVSRTPISLN
jgi:hypothetical protein